MGLILKTTKNYKPLWVPNPKIPMEFRHKPNPYPNFGSGSGITLGYPNFGYPILALVCGYHYLKSRSSDHMGNSPKEDVIFYV